MATITLELPAELMARLEQISTEIGQPLDTLVADALVAHFAPFQQEPNTNPADAARRIRLRPVRLVGWPADATFRREEIYGDDAR